MGSTLITMHCGSTIYGTRTPQSDIDLKSVIVPEPRAIVWQTAPRAVTRQTKADPRARNQAGDIDDEAFSLHFFVKLATQGQTVALEMLFTPERFWQCEADPAWRELVANRDRLVSRKATAFVEYCRAQANKYGAKGTRLASARAIVDVLKALPLHSSLREHEAALRAFAATHEHSALHELTNAATKLPNPQLEVVGRSVQLGATVQYALKMFEKVLSSYGVRSQRAESAGGADWKALMHAVRIADEGLELLTTGAISLPRPNAAELLRIRNGEVAHDKVLARVDQGLAAVEAAQASSALPDEADHAYVGDFVFRVYGERIARALQENAGG